MALEQGGHRRVKIKRCEAKGVQGSTGFDSCRAEGRRAARGTIAGRRNSRAWARRRPLFRRYREKKIELAPGAARRNLVTRGVPLNHLVGREFQVGVVRLHGTRLCEPCQYLEGLTAHGVLAGLIHRGGLRAKIIESGGIRVGDVVAIAS